jgi:hypothetical protein
MVMISPLPGVSAGVQLPEAVHTVEDVPVQVRETSVASIENFTGSKVSGSTKDPPASKEPELRFVGKLAGPDSSALSATLSDTIVPEVVV